MLFGFSINRKAHITCVASSDRGATVTGFLIDGENTSDQPRTDGQAAPQKKQERWESQLALRLNNRSQPHEPSRTLLPGAQFSLGYTLSNYLTGSSNIASSKNAVGLFSRFTTRMLAYPSGQSSGISRRQD